MFLLLGVIMSCEINKQEFYDALLFLARVSETAIVYAEVSAVAYTTADILCGILTK